jgi:hypothetical protein
MLFDKYYHKTTYLSLYFTKIQIFVNFIVKLLILAIFLSH